MIIGGLIPFLLHPLFGSESTKLLSSSVKLHLKPLRFCFEETFGVRGEAASVPNHQTASAAWLSAQRWDECPWLHVWNMRRLISRRSSSGFGWAGVCHWLCDLHQETCACSGLSLTVFWAAGLVVSRFYAWKVFAAPSLKRIHIEQRTETLSDFFTCSESLTRKRSYTEAFV